MQLSSPISLRKSTRATGKPEIGQTALSLLTWFYLDGNTGKSVFNTIVGTLQQSEDEMNLGAPHWLLLPKQKPRTLSWQLIKPLWVPLPLPHLTFLPSVGVLVLSCCLARTVCFLTSTLPLVSSFHLPSPWASVTQLAIQPQVLEVSALSQGTCGQQAGALEPNWVKWIIYHMITKTIL